MGYVVWIGKSAMMPDTKNGSTHWDGCWRDPEHWECAVAEVERMRRDYTSSSEVLASFQTAAKELGYITIADAFEGPNGIEALRNAIASERERCKRLLSAVSRVCDPGSPDEYNEALANLARVFESMTPTATVPAVPEPPK